MNPIEEYIAAQDDAVRPRLNAIRDVIRAALSDATEKISYQMPTYWKGHNIIHFAANKRHIGLYPGPEAVECFAEKLNQAGCRYRKGSIQIPYSDNLPLDLIAEIAGWCGKTGNHA